MGIYFVVTAGLLSTIVAFRDIPREKKARWFVLVSGLCTSLGAIYMQRENDQSTAELKAATTGGDSFAHLEPMLDDKGVFRLFTVIHDGDAPLRNVNVRVLDLVKLDAIRGPHGDTQEAFDAASFFLSVEALPVQNTFSVPTRGLLTGDEVRLNVSFSALNGSWLENYYAKKFSGGWRSAFIVRRQGPGGLTVIKKFVENGFPTADLPEWMPTN